MFEKLKRDRSTRNQTRNTSGNGNNQLSSPRSNSTVRDDSHDRRGYAVRRRDALDSKIATSYPPLEDYAE